MIIMSTFDGISCGRVALERAGIPVTRYYASEIDKYAITVAQANWPDNVQIGDVRVVRQMCEAGLFGHVDMLIGGSPCQNLSFAGKQDGFSVEITDLEHYKQLVAEGFEFKGQSYLFWEYVWIRELLKPTWWLLENVRMKKEYLSIFDKIMGVEGVFINSALVSAQNRQRYYWCNWPVSQPEDRGIYLRDIIETGEVDRLNVATYMKQLPRGNNKGFEKEVDKSTSMTSSSWEHNNLVTLKKKSNTVRAGGDEALPDSRHYWDNALAGKMRYRKLTVTECCRLQGLPDNYCSAVSNSRAYAGLGNGWQGDTILHIFEEWKSWLRLLGMKI